MQESNNQESIDTKKLVEESDTASTVGTAPLSSDEMIHTGAAGEAESMPSIEQLLREAELRAEEHHDAWLRAKAETENLRKRAQVDVTNAHKYAIDKFSAELLPVMDSLEAALMTENATVENFKDGIELTRKQLASIFEKFNIQVINPQGEKFDPHHHQAMCTIESDVAPNTIVQVMQKGYALHERVIRPAMVAVAKAKEA